MIFIYELDPYSLKIASQTKNELFMSGLSKVIVLHTYTDTQTDRQPRKLLPRRFAIISGVGCHSNSPHNKCFFVYVFVLVFVYNISLDVGPDFRCAL